MITLGQVLILAAILFCISVAGIFINRKNVIILLMCIELMLLSVNMNFIAFSHFLHDMAGQIFVFFILGSTVDVSSISSSNIGSVLFVIFIGVGTSKNVVKASNILSPSMSFIERKVVKELRISRTLVGIVISIFEYKVNK